MAKIIIEKDGKVIFKGEYEFVEAGIDKQGSIGFHIDSHDDQYSGTSFHLTFENKEEYIDFLNSLQKQIFSIYKDKDKP